MSVHVGDHLPAIGLEPSGRVIGEPARHFTVDGNAVVIVEGDQLAETLGSGQRAGLMGYSLHQASVAEKHPGPVIDDFMSGAVELRAQGPFRNRHAHRVGQALAQGAGGGLHSGRVAVFGVSRGPGMQLAEIPQLVQWQVIPRQVQQGILQHGPMAVGQDEPVPVGPFRVGRIMPMEIVPQHLGDVRHPHGGAGMAALGLLHRVHAEGANGVCPFPPANVRHSSNSGCSGSQPAHR